MPKLYDILDSSVAFIYAASGHRGLPVRILTICQPAGFKPSFFLQGVASPRLIIHDLFALERIMSVS